MVTKCPLLNSTENCQECYLVEQMWDIEKLMDDITKAKTVSKSKFFYDGMTLQTIKSDTDLSRKYKQLLDLPLSDLNYKEKCYLILLLNGWGYQEIEHSRFIPQKTSKSDLSRGIYKYVKILTGKDKIEHPLFVKQYLEPEYRTRLVKDVTNIPKEDLKMSLTFKSLNQEQFEKLCIVLRELKQVNQD